MTIIAGGAVIAVTCNTLVLAVCFTLGMAGCGTGEFRIIGRVLMTIGTCIPLTTMLAGINGEI